jgi:glyoxylase-like metal-dependent hydrolase (beta-lactamase superfamily II)
MTSGASVVSWSAALLLIAVCPSATLAVPTVPADSSKLQITILYDAFGKLPGMQKDWGYAALIEYGGKRILFDAGNNPDILTQNARAKDIDLSKLDFVVMSHRHGDHMGVCPEGGIWRLWRRSAEQLLPQGPFFTARGALLRRCTA